MKVIFSRKGWDSSAGGKASPVFPSGELYSLPIPCDLGSPAYKAIKPGAVQRAGFRSTADLIAELSPKASFTHAHLDPDLDSSSLTRFAGWCPCFGQRGNAARHLDNQKIGVGDLFLFYGWFDDEASRTPWHYKRQDRYIIWGWLQVSCILDPTGYVPPWLTYHPHVVHAAKYSPNRIYLGAKHLSICGLTVPGWPGAGVFCKEHPSRALTVTPGSRGRCPDAIPVWLSFSKHRQEQVWQASNSPRDLNYIRSFFV